MCNLYAIKFQSIALNIDEAEEIRILKDLDIDLNFIADPVYADMKWNIDRTQVLYFAKALKNGQVIIETLRKMIEESDVPDTFLYMAMVESKFLTTAKSSKSAAGLWQLMPKTAKHLKLTINHKIDERLDPIRSTEVAIEYLQYLHSRFHKWYLVAFAYNCGETRLAKAIKKSGSDDIFTLLDSDAGYLPKETQRYIRKLIVASLIAHSDVMLQEAQLISSESGDVKLKTLKVKEGTSLKKVASDYHVPVKVLKKYNAHILKGVTPKGSKKYCIYIPEDKVNHAKSICSSNENIFTYTVKEGDTLFLISKRFNNKISAIKNLNEDLSTKLKIGKKIALIGEQNASLKVKDIKFRPKTATKMETTKLSVSDKGIEEKSSIKEQESKKEKLPTKKVAVKDNNKTKTTKIQKHKPNTKSKKEKTFTYKVQKGEELFDISKKFNNRISTLERLNGKLPKRLKVGRTLIIKR